MLEAAARYDDHIVPIGIGALKYAFVPVEDANDSLDHKRSKLSPLENGIDLDALLKRKSIHDKDANKVRVLRY